MKKTVHWDYEDTLELGLHRYVRLVAEEIGLPGNAYYVQSRPHAEAYLALDQRLPAYPERDAALIWDEHRGWALAVEHERGDELVIVGHLPAPETVPQPRIVAEFAKTAADGGPPGSPSPARSDTPGEALARLRTYASPLPAGNSW